MKKLFAFLGAVILFTACSNKDKKIVVMSKGPSEINTDTKTIKAADGGGHEEKTVVVSGDKVAFKLFTPAGEATIELPESGLYLINAKNDTIIGSYQQYSDPKLAHNMITQESLKQRIDSL